MRNVNLTMVYQEVKLMRKKLESLEDILIPEVEFSKEELEEIDKLRVEALGEHRKGQTIKIDEL